MNTENSLIQSFRTHWPEYLMESWGLGMFMISACFFTALLYHPSSVAHHAISSGFVRGLMTGLAMGLTAIAIIHSPWGKRSGAHLNPAFTWTFFRLRKIAAPDAFFYSIAQFAGGVLGVAVAALFLRMQLQHPSVRYAATLPGPSGVAVAFVAEMAISCVLMFTVLTVSNHPRLNRFTSLFAGALIATYITFEAPLSGMSMNPARTIGSAVSANEWTALWIYFAAPLLGMLIAAEIYLRTRGIRQVFCAKYHHQNSERCIFRCNFGALKQLNQGEKSLC